MTLEADHDEVIEMTGAEHRIVAGIDGSPASKSALAWAIDEARSRGCGVLAVHAWEFPALALARFGETVVPMLTAEDVEKVAQDSARAVVDEVVGDDLSVPVTVSVRNGHAAQVLADAGRDADLLVVGSEGHGAFAGMVLGSVSTYLVHHAPCAVTIVRPGWRASGAA